MDISQIWHLVQLYVEGLIVNREEQMESLQKKIEQESSEYEPYLQKLESEVRNHIKIE